MRDLLNRNAEVFSKHKADIGCCNFVEHEIELEEGAVPHREGARRMTPHKSEACRAEIEMLLEYDMIEPSKSPWACGVVMAKKKGGQLRFCCDFRIFQSQRGPNPEGSLFHKTGGVRIRRGLIVANSEGSNPEGSIF